MRRVATVVGVLVAAAPTDLACAAPDFPVDRPALGGGGSGGDGATDTASSSSGSGGVEQPVTCDAAGGHGGQGGAAGGAPSGCTGLCGDVDQDCALTQADVDLLELLVDGSVLATPCMLAAGDLLGGARGGSPLSPRDAAMLPYVIDRAVVEPCQPCDYLCGDCDGDGAACELPDFNRMMGFGNRPPTACELWRCDLNRDGKVTGADAGGDRLLGCFGGLATTCEP